MITVTAVGRGRHGQQGERGRFLCGGQRSADSCICRPAARQTADQELVPLARVGTRYEPIHDLFIHLYTVRSSSRFCLNIINDNLLTINPVFKWISIRLAIDSAELINKEHLIIPKESQNYLSKCIQ